jgi:hypothetical protein
MMEQSLLDKYGYKTVKEYYNTIIDMLKKNTYAPAEIRFLQMTIEDRNKFLHYVWDSHDFWGLDRKQTNTIIHWLN